jgi:hypothetical protein
MTELDDRLRAAGESFRAEPVPDLSLQWPQERQARRWLAPLAVAAAVALVIGGVVAVKSLLGGRATPPANPVPTLVPDREYAVGVPFIGGTGGPALGPRPAVCRANVLHATATTRPSGEGVVGLITITARSCSLPVDVSSLGLVGAGDRPLQVHASKGNTTNLPYLRSGFAEQDGTVRVGFAWSGSYCGPVAKSVAVNVGGNDALIIALTGPSPSCRPGAAASVLIPGVVGGLDDAVEPPPVSWHSLTAKVLLPKTVLQVPIPLTVVLTNTGRTPVSLSSPCAKYVTTVKLAVGAISTEIGGSFGDLCGSSFTVLPGRPVTLTLPGLEFPTFSDTPRTRVSSGDPVTVTWAIAGVPPATATTHVR